MIPNIKGKFRNRNHSVGKDLNRLDDLYEKIVLETQGDRITPLVTNPGRIMLTSSRLYFQPFNNVDPVRANNMFIIWALWLIPLAIFSSGKRVIFFSLQLVLVFSTVPFRLVIFSSENKNHSQTNGCCTHSSEQFYIK